MVAWEQYRKELLARYEEVMKEICGLDICRGWFQTRPYTNLRPRRDLLGSTCVSTRSINIRLWAHTHSSSPLWGEDGCDGLCKSPSPLYIFILSGTSFEETSEVEGRCVFHSRMLIYSVFLPPIIPPTGGIWGQQSAPMPPDKAAPGLVFKHEV